MIAYDAIMVPTANRATIPAMCIGFLIIVVLYVSLANYVMDSVNGNSLVKQSFRSGMMKLLMIFPLLLSLDLVMVGTGDAFAGGEAYANRANAYWLQFYVTVAIIIGVVAAFVISLYKFKIRKVTA